MQSDDGEENAAGLSNYYGPAPVIAGLIFAAALIGFLFALADGFS